MIPCRILNATTRLGAPKDWDEARDGTCDGLDVLIRGDCYTSCWEPTPEEVARIAAGAKVYLTCKGLQPGVWIEAGDPA